MVNKEKPATFLLSLVAFLFIFYSEPAKAIAAENYWEIQSIDTMKFSRDLAREKLGDPAFIKTIDSHTKKIAEVGATHVAVGTPYDEEFLPLLKLWVTSARNYDLKVWFRGNWSGWEGWFDYESITPDEHILKTRKFILDNSGLFEDGDIFTSCTECENGWPGNIYDVRELQVYRSFLLNEYGQTDWAFQIIGKDVVSNFYSMNADIARLVMDKNTTEKLGGVVVIDHYVKEPKTLASDISEIAQRSGGKVVLGEMGVPIPDIHGEFSKEQQTRWLGDALSYLVREEELIGVNYWVGFGGTTAIWETGGSQKPAVDLLKNYFTPEVKKVKVVNELGYSVRDAKAELGGRTIKSDTAGYIQLLIVPGVEEVRTSAKGYEERSLDISELSDGDRLILKKTEEGLIFKAQKAILGLLLNVKEKIISFSIL